MTAIFGEKGEIEFNRPCSGYYKYVDADDAPPSTPCRCPVCGGWLTWMEKEGEGNQPVCNKCGVELITIPETEMDNGKLIEYPQGKICPIGESKSKAIREEELRTKRLVKAGHRAWKGFL